MNESKKVQNLKKKIRSYNRDFELAKAEATNRGIKLGFLLLKLERKVKKKGFDWEEYAFDEFYNIDDMKRQRLIKAAKNLGKPVLHITLDDLLNNFFRALDNCEQPCDCAQCLERRSFRAKVFTLLDDLILI